MEFNFAPHVYLIFLIFVASKLLHAKIEELKFNEILNHIYIIIYDVLEIYGLKNM